MKTQAPRSFQWAFAICLTLFQAMPLSGLAQGVRGVGEPINQPNHRRILFMESWRGSYLLGARNDDMGVIRFQVCGIKNQSHCQHITENLPPDDVVLYESYILKELKAYLEELRHDTDTSLWRFVLGGSKQDPDIRALTEIIRQIEMMGLTDWMYLRHEDIQTNAPQLATPEVADRIYDIMSQNFEVPAAELRQQEWIRQKEMREPQ